jgi:hypothetical protein
MAHSKTFAVVNRLVKELHSHPSTKTNPQPGQQPKWIANGDWWRGEPPLIAIIRKNAAAEGAFIDAFTEPRRWQLYLLVAEIRPAPLPSSFPVTRLGYVPRRLSGAVCV